VHVIFVINNKLKRSPGAEQNGVRFQISTSYGMMYIHPLTYKPLHVEGSRTFIPYYYHLS